MPQLDFSIFPSQFFWLFISFFLMLCIFKFFIIPKTGEMINLRKIKIDEYLAQAEILKKKVQKTLDKYNQALENATVSAQKSLEQTRQEVDGVIERRQKELDAELREKIAQGEAEITAHKDKTLKQIELVSEELASQVLEKIGLSDIVAHEISKKVKDK